MGEGIPAEPGEEKLCRESSSSFFEKLLLFPLLLLAVLLKLNWCPESTGVFFSESLELLNCIGETLLGVDWFDLELTGMKALNWMELKEFCCCSTFGGCKRGDLETRSIFEMIACWGCTWLVIDALLFAMACSLLAIGDLFIVSKLSLGTFIVVTSGDALIEVFVVSSIGFLYRSKSRVGVDAAVVDGVTVLLDIMRNFMSSNSSRSLCRSLLSPSSSFALSANLFCRSLPL